MKKIFRNLMAVAIAAMTFTACEDVPAPYDVLAEEEDNTEVIDPAGSGTLEDPYNVAAAIAKCKEIGTEPSTEKYYVKGIVVSGGTADATYGNAKFYIADTPESSERFYCFQVLGSNGEKMPAGYAINEGDEVVVYGPIYNYQGTTPETAGKGAAYIVTINGVSTSENGGGGTSTTTTHGTVDAPVSIAEALEVINALENGASTDDEYYIGGTITKIETSADNIAKYKNIDYIISDGTGEIKVFRGKNLNNTDFTQEGEINVGDQVVVLGKLMKYYNEKTSAVVPEIAQGNYIVKLTSGEGGGTTTTHGTVDAPVSIAEALNVINALENGATTDDEYYIGGTITKIETSAANIAKYKNIDYIISDGTNEIKVFRGKNLNNTDFTKEGEINVGDQVVVLGKLMKYYNEKTSAVVPEIAQGNYIVKLTSGEGGGTTGGETSGTGTPESPLSASQANAIATNLGAGNTSTEDYYIKGKVVSIATDKNGNAQNYDFGTYGNATFYISEDGTATNQFLVYRALYLGNKKWESGAGDVLKVGDDVIICGKLTNYNGTPETSQNKAYLYSLNGKTE